MLKRLSKNISLYFIIVAFSPGNHYIVIKVFFCLQWPKAYRDLPAVPGSEDRDIIQSQLTWDLPQQRAVRDQHSSYFCRGRWWQADRVKMVLCEVLLWSIRYSASVHLFIYYFLNRPFIKLKECSSSSSGRPNISRSSSSTSSFSSTTGETEALEELETVSATLTVRRRKCINITGPGVYTVLSLSSVFVSSGESRTGISLKGVWGCW